MRPSAPLPTPTPLPRSAPRDAHPPDLSLPADAVASFDALLHDIHPDAEHVEPHRIHALCAWLASLPAADARETLECRLLRLEQLRRLLSDDAWDAGAAARARIARLVDYADLREDLIPDDRPLIGRLDDVLLLELAWPALAEEADDYADFCDYRAQAHPHGSGDEQRAAWIRDRLAEVALLRHQARVHDSHYGPVAPATAPFHVGG